MEKPLSGRVKRFTLAQIKRSSGARLVSTTAIPAPQNQNEATHPAMESSVSPLPISSATANVETPLKARTQQAFISAKECNEKAFNELIESMGGSLVLFGQDALSLYPGTSNGTDPAIASAIGGDTTRAKVSDDQYEGATIYYPDGETISTPDASTPSEDTSFDEPSVDDEVMIVKTNGQVEIIPRSDLNKGKGIDRKAHQGSSRFGSWVDNGEGGSRPRIYAPPTEKDLRKKIDEQEEEIDRLQLQISDLRFRDNKPARQPASKDEYLRRQLTEARDKLIMEEAVSQSLRDLVADMEKANAEKLVESTPTPPPPGLGENSSATPIKNFLAVFSGRELLNLIHFLLEQHPDAIFDAIMSHRRTSGRFQELVSQFAAKSADLEYNLLPNKRRRIHDKDELPGQLVAIPKSCPISSNNVELTKYAAKVQEKRFSDPLQREISAERSSPPIYGESHETTPFPEQRRPPRNFRNSQQTHKLNGTLHKKRPAAHQKVKTEHPPAKTQVEDEVVLVFVPAQVSHDNISGKLNVQADHPNVEVPVEDANTLTRQLGQEIQTPGVAKSILKPAKGKKVQQQSKKQALLRMGNQTDCEADKKEVKEILAQCSVSSVKTAEGSLRENINDDAPGLDMGKAEEVPINDIPSLVQMTQASNESKGGVNREEIEAEVASSNFTSKQKSQKTRRVVMYRPQYKRIQLHAEEKKMKKKVQHRLKNNWNSNLFIFIISCVLFAVLVLLARDAVLPALKSSMTTVAGGIFSFFAAARTSFNFALQTLNSPLGHVAQEATSTPTTPESVISDLLGWTHQSEGVAWTPSLISCPPPAFMHLHMNPPAVSLLLLVTGQQIVSGLLGWSPESMNSNLPHTDGLGLTSPAPAFMHLRIHHQLRDAEPTDLPDSSTEYYQIQDWIMTGVRGLQIGVFVTSMLHSIVGA
ncbi:hypothetical protein BKA65DRAFT_477262 [Rhexocercosporidium sp. MPI-PUGE-AT-0058]|nr:hypothetical protein BKA65DRAFT_477262 [Rhexocercosporidium sp. MPI-PUGE-AT-0058]